jgi:hypothetical protein
MDHDTVRSDEVDAYWRRRVVALGGVLSAVGLMVWACSGSGSGGKKQPVRNAAAVSSPSPSPAAVPTGGSAMPLPTVTVTATAKVTVTPAPPKKPGDRCDAGNVVVSLGPTKGTFGKGEHAQFRLTVVNTGAQACTFGVGPNELQIQIASGSDKVWSSAKCFAGTGSSIQMLQRGIPYGGIVDWDRHRTVGDCTAKRPTARAGTYTIIAKGGGIKTKKAVFFLR